MGEDKDDLAVDAPWLARWRRLPDGAAFASQRSRLLPVRRDGAALMLKAVMAEQDTLNEALPDPPVAVRAIDT